MRPFADGADALACMRADPEVAALITSGEIGFGMSGLELCWENARARRARPADLRDLMSSSIDKNRLARRSTPAPTISSPPPVADDYARLRAAERLGAMQRELVRLASIDPLTGLFNRRIFFERAEATRERFEGGGALTAIMLDIDHFKRINDLYGHDVGDLTIASVAQLAAAVGALVGRLGGEEFAILTEGQHLSEGVKLAERLRAAIAALKLNTANGPLTLTCSFGVSERKPGESIDDLLKAPTSRSTRRRPGGATAWSRRMRIAGERSRADFLGA